MEKEEKLYGLTNDFLFKAVFGQEYIKTQSSLRAEGVAI